MTTYAYDQLVEAFKRARADIQKDFVGDGVRETLVDCGVDRVAYAIADLVAADDPKFDSEGFLKRVGA